MLELNKVTKYYKNEKVLDEITMTIKEGEFVSLLGPSGCGKSTLVHIISGLNQASDGEVSMDGRKITRPSTDRIMVFQSNGLFPWLTVEQNVAFGKKDNGNKISKDEVKKLLKMIRLTSYRHKYPHQLSGGMKQRVSIARSLAMDPQLLLMDEPFSALDEQTKNELHDELQKIWMETGKTIIFVTHNIREAVKLSDRVLVMGNDPGRIICDVRISEPHPRSHADQNLVALESSILRLLEKEIRKQKEGEELHGTLDEKKSIFNGSITSLARTLFYKNMA